MGTVQSRIEKRVKAFCALIGADRLLVQGAGGNVSWKDDNILWVKASGMWLADAEAKEIFVPVKLLHLRTALKQNNFSVTPQVWNDTKLRPSIETLLHALMPHKFVLHLHAIDILSYMVQPNFSEGIKQLLSGIINFGCIDYYKPGSELAKAVDQEFKLQPNIDVIFMKNHGVVIGGANISEISNTLSKLNTILSSQIKYCLNKRTLPAVPDELAKIYRPLLDLEISSLSLVPAMFARLKDEWCLYPDHVVFLGPAAFCYSSWQEVDVSISKTNVRPELIFIKDIGVYALQTFSEAQLVQLRCYADVLLRQDKTKRLCSLSNEDVRNLLNWEAEAYRVNLALRNIDIHQEVEK
jgi:rhamnose utilization protein RhaD (predicted bifunctional aldolase and dehydrogenase)